MKVWNPRKIKLIGLSIYVFCQIFFVIGLKYPRGFNFDEFHYVPSAKQFLELKTNQNWEHPPLGKLLMAVGIGLFGDEPFGWRIMSTLFGSITAVGMYFLALVLFQSEEAALWTFLITLVNQLLYVQARIGMLDTFMFCFLVWGMAAFCATWLPAKKRWSNRVLLSFTGAMLGLTTACKWFGLMPWMGCIFLICCVRLMQFAQIRPLALPEQEWYQPTLWKDVKWKNFAVSLLLIPAICYFATFIPYLFINDGNNSIFNWWAMQLRMWDGQLRVVTSHPYMSEWYQWPLLLRPIWYAFEKELGDPNSVRGVLLLGNPFLMWLGLLAILKCFWDGYFHRNASAFLIAFFYFVFYGCWLFIPRKISFYYYYYPAGMTLSLALGYVFYKAKGPFFQQLQKGKWYFFAVALGIFVYFFPILAALKLPADAYRNWMWFPFWI